MTDAAAQAASDIAAAYIMRVHQRYEENDVGAVSSVGIKYQLKRLDQEFENFRTAQTKLIASADGESKAKLLEQLVNVDAMYQHLYEKFGDRGEDLDRTVNEQALAAEKVRNPPKPRKPLEGLTDFDGTHQSWPAFRDLFCALVVNVGVSRLECFLLLKKHCKGSAEQMLEGYALVEASFEPAWLSLKEIYEDKYSIMQSLIDKVMNLEQANGKVVTEVRKVVETIRSTLRQLAGMGVKTRYWDAVMINIAARKLPAGIIREWEKERDVEVLPDLETLLTFVDSRTRLRLFTPAGQNAEQKPGVNNGSRQWKPNTGPSPGASGSQKPENGKADGKAPVKEQQRHERVSISCWKCKGGHPLAFCPDFLAIKDTKVREEEVKKLNLCVNCFGKAHQAAECKKQGCEACPDQKHSALLCPKKDGRAPKRNGHQVHQNAQSGKRKRWASPHAQ